MTVNNTIKILALFPEKMIGSKINEDIPKLNLFDWG